MAISTVESTVILDIYDHDVSRTTIKSIAFDSDTRFVIGDIRNRDESYNVGLDSTITLTVIRPDEVGVSIPGEPWLVSEATYGVRAELTQAALIQVGTLQAQFKIENGDQILRTEIFLIKNGTALDESTSEWAGDYQGHNLDELVEQVDTNSEDISALQNEMVVERGRIDAIASLPEGSTTGDAELADIRTGVDGTVYQNAGTAVRTQIRALQGDISDVQEDISRLDDLDDIIAEALEPVETKADATETKVNRIKPVINVGAMVETLTSANLADAIAAALLISDRIYIPAGSYEVNLVITTDCTIYLDDGCYISTATSTPAISASNCSIKIYGGNVFAGENDDSRVPVYWSVDPTLSTGIIFLNNCHDCVIDGLKSSWSKYAGIIRVMNCTNVLVQNCSFSNFLMVAVAFILHNENVIVRNCSFINSDKITGYDYCYAVSTGAVALSDSFVPIDGLIYENNYVYDSEDCGLDTHGASNVIIRNNRVLQTVCAITAYNDNRRVVRPSGWSMRNILIENNYCETDKDNESSREYPHAFIFLGGANMHPNTDSGYENNPGSYYSFCNCIVQNNYFKSPNTHEALIFLDVVSRDVLIQNNVIDCMNSAKPLNPVRSIGIRVINNSFLNCNKTMLFTSCLGEVADNSGVKYDLTLSKPSCIVGCKGDHQGTASPLIKLGQFVFDGGNPCVGVNYGIRFRPSRTVPSPVSIAVDSNGVATLAKHDFIPGLALRITVGIVYVQDVIDMKHFIIAKPNGEAIPSGTYTAEFLTATVSEFM